MHQNRRTDQLINGETSSQWDLMIESTNRWVKLAREVPWEFFVSKYGSLVDDEKPGNASEQVRMLLGALIIKEKYGFSDRETIDQIRENPYLQYFVGMKEFTGDLPFDVATLVDFRLRLDLQALEEIRHWTEDGDDVKLSYLGEPKRDYRKQGGITPEAHESDGEEPLERTLEMPAVTEHRFGLRLNVEVFNRWFSRIVQLLREQCGRLNDLIENAKMESEDKLAEFLNAKPELLEFPRKIMNNLQHGWNCLRRILGGISWRETVWFRNLLIVGCTFLLAFILLLIFLPVPAPRMLMASEVYDTKHRLAATFYSENRRPVKLKEIPVFLRQAVLAIEDHRFYKHSGINLGRILKAAWYDLTHGSVEQGGSTITQQLVKNVYLTHERTLARKFQEFLISIKLEFKLSKDEIFELYLNKIYFGHGAYGVKVAAETYFQKDLSELNEAEMAMLAGLPRGPSYYSPYKHPKSARKRLELVLSRMKECGFINEVQYKQCLKEKLNLPGLKTRNNLAPYFMDMLQNEIVRLFPENPQLLYTAGVKIESTIDLDLHRYALKAFNQGLPVIYRREGAIPQPQGAFIAMDPNNGEVRVLIGGTDYNRSQFNRAIQAKRQPGSAFKPIIYAAAFGNGFTLASQIDREPKTYHIGSTVYCPTDHHGGTGMMSLRNALAQSSNVVAVKLLEQVGFKPVFTAAEQLGIKSKLKPRLSLALGACELTPMELATAYATLANGGTRFSPTTIRRIIDHQGNVIYQNNRKGVKAFDPGVAYITTQAMTEVLKSGTAAAIGAMLKHPAAGKTGTTNNNRDTWFVGYTPDLLACVFVGCDNYERNLPGMASQVAAPIWGNFMQEALKKYPIRDFPMPYNVKKVALCATTGLIANKSCPVRTEYFISGSEPSETCNRNHLFNLFEDLFGEHSREKNKTEIPDEDHGGEVREPEQEREGKEQRKFGDFFRRIIRKL